MQRVLAIDIGGTKMDVGIVDIDEGIIERRRAPSAGVVDGDALFDRLAALIDEIRATGAADGVRLCGVGCGGPMTLGGAEVSPLNIPAWRDFPLRERLSAHTGPFGVDFRSLRFPGLISAVTVPSGGTSDFLPEMVHAAARGERYECFVREDTRIPFMAMPDAIRAPATPPITAGTAVLLISIARGPKPDAS